MDVSNCSLTCGFILNSVSACMSVLCLWAGHPPSGGFIVSWTSPSASGWAWHWAACQTQVLFVVSAVHWTLQGPHIHKGMFGWIRYTATHTACLPVWLHNSNLTSKLGQWGSRRFLEAGQWIRRQSGGNARETVKLFWVRRVTFRIT